MENEKPLTEKDKIFVFCNHENMTVNAMEVKLGVSRYYLNQFMKDNDLKPPILKMPRHRRPKEIVVEGYFNVDDLKNMY